MNHYRQLLAGVGLAILGFGAGCGDEGVSLGNDGNTLDGGRGGAGGEAGRGGDAAGRGGGAGGEAGSRAPLSAAEVLALLQTDFATPGGAREGVRYVSLHTFYNEASFSDDQVRGAADAVSKLLNHLATAQTSVKRPAPVGPAGGPPVALRFELRDYDLTAADWDLIERGGNVPSRGGPCAAPVIAAEQFLAAAASDQNYVVGADTFESVYSNITLRKALARAGVLAPEQLVFDPISKQNFISFGFTNLSNVVSFDDVARAYGVELQAETQAAAAGTPGAAAVARSCARAGADAGPACTQRHGRPDGGNLWWTMRAQSPQPGADQDPFLRPIGPANPPSDPVIAGPAGEGFRVDAGDAIWSLPNRLAAFTAFNANFQLISSSLGQNAKFQSTTAAYFENNVNYVAPAPDALRAHVAANEALYDAAEVDFVRRLVPPQNELDALVARDRAAYAGAVNGTYYGAPPADGAAPFFQTFDQDLTLARVLATLALTVDEFVALLDTHPAIAAGMLDPRTSPPDATISRELFITFLIALRGAVEPPAESLANACVVQ